MIIAPHILRCELIFKVTSFCTLIFLMWHVAICPTDGRVDLYVKRKSALLGFGFVLNSKLKMMLLGLWSKWRTEHISNTDKNQKIFHALDVKSWACVVSVMFWLYVLLGLKLMKSSFHQDWNETTSQKHTAE